MEEEGREGRKEGGREGWRKGERLKLGGGVSEAGIGEVEGRKNLQDRI